MLSREQYLSLKREIRCFCRKHIKDLCCEMELNNFKKELLMRFYDKEKVQKTCMDLGLSQPTYTLNMKILLSKIYDYKNTH